MTEPPDPVDAHRETAERTRSAYVTPSDLERMLSAIGSLDAADREVFLAHRLDGFGLEHIALVTGLSLIDVEQMIARAMAALDREFCRSP